MIHLTNLNSANMYDQLHRGDSDDIDEIVLTDESDQNIVIFNDNDGDSIAIPEIETCDILIDQTARYELELSEKVSVLYKTVREQKASKNLLSDSDNEDYL